MDDTITGTPVGDAGASALPDVQPQETTAEISQDQAQGDQQPAGDQTGSLPGSADEKLVKFAESHGLDLDSPSAVKAAKIAMDNQAEFQRAQQKASQLDKSLQTQPQQPQADRDSLMEEFIRDYRRDKMLNQFKEATPDWKQHETAMVEKLAEPVNTPYGTFTRSQLVNEGLLSLQDVYAMAKGSITPAPTEDVTNVLQSIANKQRAGSVSGNAVNSAPAADDTDPILEGIRKHRNG